MAESFSRKKIKACTAERRWMRNPVCPSSYVTPAGTSIDVQNEWEENTHTHFIRPFLTRKFFQELFGLEGSKKFLEKNRQVHNLKILDRLLGPILCEIENADRKRKTALFFDLDCSIRKKSYLMR